MVNQEEKQGSSGFRVTPEQKDFILQQLAEGCTSEEIQGQFQDTFSLYVSIRTIDGYRVSEEDLILEKRKALQYHLDRILHASKYIRVKTLDKEIKNVKERLRDDTKARAMAVKELCEQIRKDMEGFKASLSLDAGNPFESLLGKVDVDTLNRILEILKKEEKAGKGTGGSEIVDE